jgi:hypothetical protein
MRKWFKLASGLQPIRDPNSRNQRRKHHRALAERIKRDALLDRVKARVYRDLKKQSGRITAEEVMQLEALLEKHKESGRYTVAVD